MTTCAWDEPWVASAGLPRLSEDVKDSVVLRRTFSWRQELLHYIAGDKTDDGRGNRIHSVASGDINHRYESQDSCNPCNGIAALHCNSVLSTYKLGSITIS